jgi:hypothetical protein
MYLGVCVQCCRPIHTGEAFKKVLVYNGLGPDKVKTYVYQHRGNCVKWPDSVNHHEGR